MKYTVSFTIDIDNDEIYETEEIEGIVADCLDSADIRIRGFNVLSIDD